MGMAEKDLVYVHSTLTNGTDFAIYVPRKKDDATNDQRVNVIQRIIHIDGHANVASRGLETLDGKVTEITREELNLLRAQCPSFVRTEKRGFFTVKDYHRLKTSDMEKKDGSAPLTPEDYGKGNRKRGPKPKTDTTTIVGGGAAE